MMYCTEFLVFLFVNKWSGMQERERKLPQNLEDPLRRGRRKKEEVKRRKELWLKKAKGEKERSNEGRKD